jgi:hypothetical protein
MSLFIGTTAAQTHAHTQPCLSCTPAVPHHYAHNSVTPRYNQCRHCLQKKSHHCSIDKHTHTHTHTQHTRKRVGPSVSGLAYSLPSVFYESALMVVFCYQQHYVCPSPAKQVDLSSGPQLLQHAADCRPGLRLTCTLRLQTYRQQGTTKTTRVVWSQMIMRLGPILSHTRARRKGARIDTWRASTPHKLSVPHSGCAQNVLISEYRSKDKLAKCSVVTRPRCGAQTQCRASPFQTSAEEVGKG